MSPDSFTSCGRRLSRGRVVSHGGGNPRRLGPHGASHRLVSTPRMAPPPFPRAMVAHGLRRGAGALCACGEGQRKAAALCDIYTLAIPRRSVRLTSMFPSHVVVPCGLRFVAPPRGPTRRSTGRAGTRLHLAEQPSARRLP